MRAKLVCFVCVLACFTIPAITRVAAQEGHPLIGTWSGDWGPSATQRNQVLIVMEWKTTTLSGVINPGYRFIGAESHLQQTRPA